MLIQKNNSQPPSQPIGNSIEPDIYGLSLNSSTDPKPFDLKVVASASQDSCKTMNPSTYPCVKSDQLLNEVPLPTSYPPSHGSLSVSVNFHPDNFLGEGRVSRVYKGKLLPSQAQGYDQTLLENTKPIECAVKIIKVYDEDAFELGLTEACILDYLAYVHPLYHNSSFVNHYGIAYSDIDPFSSSDTLMTEDIIMPIERGSEVIKNAFQKKYACWAIVLELYSEGNAWEYMENHKDLMGIDLFMSWTKQLSLALSDLHSVSSNQNVYLCDFSAVQCSESILAEIESIYNISLKDFYTYGDLGATVTYSAPELLSSKFDPFTGFNQDTNALNSTLLSSFGSSDIYSLGISFYVLFFSGRDPFYSVKNNIQLTILVKNGKFWEWEQNHPTKNLEHSLNSSEVDLTKKQRTFSIAPSGSLSSFNLHEGLNSASTMSPDNANPTDIDSPEFARTFRSKSLNYGFGRSRISQKVTSENILKKLGNDSFDHGNIYPHSPLFFLNGDIIPSDLYLIVKNCLNVDYNNRLSALEIYNSFP
ncbi:hypothetical protein BB560_001572 [Smittium megazygosporum]|uniref:Protein kinase domain-containing protein n=1 Tax=Smittium megazygosporum TaxID=133381 RepID=A0A2T9ZH69_9FUNG|nr:hypothetical protein BB560_001572 [Smittium megazygosporum]